MDNTPNEICDPTTFLSVVSAALVVRNQLSQHGASDIVVPIRYFNGDAIDRTAAFSNEYDGPLNPEWFNNACLTTYIGFPERMRTYYDQFRALAPHLAEPGSPSMWWDEPGTSYDDFVPDPIFPPGPPYTRQWDSRVFGWSRRVTGDADSSILVLPPQPTWSGVWEQDGAYFSVTLPELITAFGMLPGFQFWPRTPDGVVAASGHKRWASTKYDPYVDRTDDDRWEADFYRYDEIRTGGFGTAWRQPIVLMLTNPGSTPVTVSFSLRIWAGPTAASFPATEPGVLGDYASVRATKGVAYRVQAVGMESRLYEDDVSYDGWFEDAPGVCGQAPELSLDNSVVIAPNGSATLTIEFYAGASAAAWYSAMPSEPDRVDDIFGGTTCGFELSFGGYTLSG